MVRKMVTRDLDVLMQYNPPVFAFLCDKNCGIYVVEPETFWNFIPESERQRIEDEIDKGVFGAFVNFKGECPKCHPEKFESKANFGVLRLKKEVLN